MRKILPLLLSALVLTSCKSTRLGETFNLQVRLLDDYTIEENLLVENTRVGGLSGIDFANGEFVLVSDQPSNPRFYKADIVLGEEGIDTIIFKEVVQLDLPESQEKQNFDLESIIYDSSSDNFYISSEGAIKEEIDPAILKVSAEGKLQEFLPLPQHLLSASEKPPRNNGALEGLAESFDKKGVWAAMELPLKSDGPKPKLIRTKSPVRITYFDKQTGKATKQFPYLLEPIAKIPWLYFAVNGVTDLLEYAPDRFLILERGFAAGHGQNGNTVRIYDVDARLGTNTLDKKSLKISFYNPAKKKLLYDFKWAKDYLSEGFIDNIEGITFGPDLPNGNRSLLLISDNNFNSLGQQANQVILMEFQRKN